MERKAVDHDKWPNRRERKKSEHLMSTSLFTDDLYSVKQIGKKRKYYN